MIHKEPRSIRRLRSVLFQIHLMVGALASVYIVLMSLTGSIVVWQAQLDKLVPIEWLVKAGTRIRRCSRAEFAASPETTFAGVPRFRRLAFAPVNSPKSGWAERSGTACQDHAA